MHIEYVMMTVNDVAEVAHIHPRTIQDWLGAGFIQPVVCGRKGAGQAHRFSCSQALGLVYAVNLRSIGAGREMIRMALEAFGRIGDDEMTALLASGIRMYLPGMGFTQPPPGIEIPSALDIAKVSGIVKARFEHLAKVRGKTAKTA